MRHHQLHPIRDRDLIARVLTVLYDHPELNVADALALTEHAGPDAQ